MFIPVGSYEQGMCHARFPFLAEVRLILIFIVLAIWRVDKDKNGTVTKTKLFSVRVSHVSSHRSDPVFICLVLVSLRASMSPSQTRKPNGPHDP